ncbi:LysR family transcriptional regulator [Arthrobacter sp. CG_A4]|uniref:LysR family transcriptional regulator n=1 Tax=Arthrobacter sp. CG_A4 TaxID=3071706 RepID=UPI002E13D548
MTLSQLRTFALVARLGSLHAAAEALGVSEPAVSSALAALRLDLGDPIFVRAAGGIALTPGGRALAVYAQDIVGLADQARSEVANAKNDAGQLKIAATPTFAEHAAGRLLDLFTTRLPGVVVDVVVESPQDLASLLHERAYDIELGARPTTPAGTAVTEFRLESAAFLRYQRAFVAAPADPLGRLHGPVAVTQLLARPWFAGPAGIQDSTEEGRWLASMAVAPDIIRLSSETDALAAVRAGEGIMLALGHIVRAEIQSGTLVRLPVVGTPVSGLWWASTLDHRRAATMAQTLKRFVGTADATAAMVAPGGSRGLQRRGSKFHVALWSK